MTKAAFGVCCWGVYARRKEVLQHPQYGTLVVHKYHGVDMCVVLSRKNGSIATLDFFEVLDRGRPVVSAGSLPTTLGCVTRG